MSQRWIRLLVYHHRRALSADDTTCTNTTSPLALQRLYLKSLEDELTTDAYVYLADENSTKDYEPMGKVKNKVYFNFRRGWLENAQTRIPELAANTPELVIAVCVMLQSTYRAGLKDLHNFYVARLPFHRTEAFELGYLAHEIVYRYQVIIELFQMAKRRYVGQDMAKKNEPFGNTMPAQYMFYVYTNIIEQAKAITHLCNMLKEVGPKYKARRERFKSVDDGPKHSPWSDISDTEPDSGEFGTAGGDRPKSQKKPWRLTNLTAMREYLAKLRKRRLRLLQKKRAMFKFFYKRYNKSSRIRPHERKPKSIWPLDYGWSAVEMLNF